VAFHATGRSASRSPWGSATPRIFESIGRRVSALGVPEATWFTATSALAHYIVGAAGQNAANARVLQVREHDDREQFLSGVDLILTGITAPAPG